MLPHPDPRRGIDVDLERSDGGGGIINVAGVIDRSQVDVPDAIAGVENGRLVAETDKLIVGIGEGAGFIIDEVIVAADAGEIGGVARGDIRVIVVGVGPGDLDVISLVVPDSHGMSRAVESGRLERRGSVVAATVHAIRPFFPAAGSGGDVEIICSFGRAEIKIIDIRGADFGFIELDDIGLGIEADFIIEGIIGKGRRIVPVEGDDLLVVPGAAGNLGGVGGPGVFLPTANRSDISGLIVLARVGVVVLVPVSFGVGIGAETIPADGIGGVNTVTVGPGG